MTILPLCLLILSFSYFWLSLPSFWVLLNLFCFVFLYFWKWRNKFAFSSPFPFFTAAQITMLHRTAFLKNFLKSFSLLTNLLLANVDGMVHSCRGTGKSKTLSHEHSYAISVIMSFHFMTELYNNGIFFIRVHPGIPEVMGVPNDLSPFPNVKSFPAFQHSLNPVALRWTPPLKTRGSGTEAAQRIKSKFKEKICNNHKRFDIDALAARLSPIKETRLEVWTGPCGSEQADTFLLGHHSFIWISSVLWSLMAQTCVCCFLGPWRKGKSASSVTFQIFIRKTQNMSIHRNALADD